MLTLAAALALGPAQAQERAQGDIGFREERAAATAAPRFSYGGLLELEAFSGEDFAGVDASDLVLATLELWAEARPNDWTTLEVRCLFEEDETEPGEIDQAFIRLGDEDTLFHLIAGRLYVPFGKFETNLVSDPLTLELGETRASALQVGFASDGLYGAFYGFNGDVDEADRGDRIHRFGAELGYRIETDAYALDLGAGYIDSIADSDGLSGADLDGDGSEGDLIGTGLTERVGGIAAHAALTLGRWTFIGEYVGAEQAFSAADLSFWGGGAQPTAWNVEAGYHFALGSREASVALGHQQTDEAVGLGLPKTRTLGALTIGLFENLAVGFEYARDDDYGVSAGGTGASADTVTVQLAVEF